MKKKTYPKAPKVPKSSTPQALANYERRIKEYEAKCAKVKKHNDGIDGLKDKKRKLTDRAQKARNK